MLTSSSHHILTSSIAHIFISSHPNIFISSHPHIFTSSQAHFFQFAPYTFTSSFFETSSNISSLCFMLYDLHSHSYISYYTSLRSRAIRRLVYIERHPFLMRSFLSTKHGSTLRTSWTQKTSIWGWHFFAKKVSHRRHPYWARSLLRKGVNEERLGH